MTMRTIFGVMAATVFAAGAQAQQAYDSLGRPAAPRMQNDKGITHVSPSGFYTLAPDDMLAIHCSSNPHARAYVGEKAPKLLNCTTREIFTFNADKACTLLELETERRQRDLAVRKYKMDGGFEDFRQSLPEYVRAFEDNCAPGTSWKFSPYALG